MRKYRINIEWQQGWESGFWDWKVLNEYTDEVLHSGNSYWRWLGLWKAGRWCEKHKNGKIRAVDDGSRSLYYEV